MTMKSLTQNALESYVLWLGPQLLHAQLQKIRTDGRRVVLTFHSPHLRQEIHLLFDSQMANPLLVLSKDFDERKIDKRDKPLTLFLRSHGIGLRVEDIVLESEKGRAVKINLVAGATHCVVRFVLVPHAVGLEIFAAGKSISWSKPRELGAPPPVNLKDSENIKDWSAWSLEALSFILNGVKEKKQKALDKLSLEIEKNHPTIEAQRWQKFGEALKYGDSFADELKDLWDAKLNRSENRERAFLKAKQVLEKAERREQRRQELETEIAQEIESPSALANKSGTQALIKAEAKGRSLDLSCGAQAVVGKSAEDNMALLRKARAWDYWLHLKDEPSAHGLIFRNKEQNIPHKDLHRVALMILSRSRWAENQAQAFSFDIIMAECRHVRNVKGLKGRVTFGDHQVLRFASKLPS
jgi:hypothetical protein